MDERICNWCRKIIPPDFSYVRITGSVVLRTGKIEPRIFTCPEQAEDFAHTLDVHDFCWIDILRRCGVEVRDLGIISKKYERRNTDGLG